MQPRAIQAILAIALATVSFRCAEAAGPPTILAKAGVSYDQREADRASCKVIADEAPLDDLPHTDVPSVSVVGYANPAAAGAGGAIAYLILAGIETTEARGRAVGICLKNMGYAELLMTPEEAAAYAPLSRADREVWERDFLATDLRARIVSASGPLVPQLPPYKVEPDGIGSIRVDPSSLVVASGPVKRGELLVTGKLSRFRTAVLSKPFEGGAGAIRLRGEAGSLFQIVDSRPERSRWLRRPSSTWCGPVTELTQGSSSIQTYCLSSLRDGYEAVRALGEPWLWIGQGGIQVTGIGGPVILDEVAATDESPIDLEIRLTTLSVRSVQVTIVARKEGRSVTLLTRELPLLSNGKAFLPLWSRRLVITRTTTSKVTAVLDDRGGGRSWRGGDD